MATKPLFSPSDMPLTVAFTETKTVTSPVNGSQVKKPVTVFTKKAGYRRRTINQTYSIQGTSLQDSILIGVRHDPRINKLLGVTLKGVNYKIETISPDETNTYIKFDLITLSKVVG